MPTVTLNANNPNLSKIRCTPSDQSITWILQPGAGAFAAQPISFPRPAPSGYDNWPGTQPGAPVNNRVSVDVNKVLQPGQMEKYKYTIHLPDRDIDPDIENTGSGPLQGPGRKK